MSSDFFFMYASFFFYIYDKEVKKKTKKQIKLSIMSHFLFEPDFSRAFDLFKTALINDDLHCLVDYFSVSVCWCALPKIPDLSGNSSRKHPQFCQIEAAIFE